MLAHLEQRLEARLHEWIHASGDGATESGLQQKMK